VARWCSSIQGPVFYRQERTGQAEKPFHLVKFRTMREDAESGTGPVWASVRDYRVTRVGRWLRLTRLDDAAVRQRAQGEMPSARDLSGRSSWRSSRRRFRISAALLVKPGHVWAQVQYRYAASVEDDREACPTLIHQEHVLEARSLIAVKTLKVVFSRRVHEEVCIGLGANAEGSPRAGRAAASRLEQTGRAAGSPGRRPGG
jgi:lipopolysaccharide/colanic/teichoic acid biosynthesis glycosyltransferase